MYQYRETLYKNYYSTHSGKLDQSVQVQHFNQQVRYFVREFQNLVPADKSVQILDIGCGTGSLIKALNTLGYNNTYGVDLSEEQVKMASAFGIACIVQADVKDYLQDKAGVYDVIFAVDLIEHLGKDELVDFLKLVNRGLKPGGTVVFRTPNMDAPLSAVFAFADFTHEVFLNKSSAKQLLQSCGYQEVEISEGITFIENGVKEIIRKIGWAITQIGLKAMLFLSARTWDEVLFSPNIVIKGKKPATR
ncbi:MAG: 2-polyprenyl-3-methyl-5-hydroxy-6-metoxy-1,4-benzoquinol methylase [Bacteroidia bacterium]|jgi:2-polyprenyl-3-methyl-5-hydroxy-6-metoxy-1,4-benzoquinol methylase